jgi:acetyl-CoA synthetase
MFRNPPGPRISIQIQLSKGVRLQMPSPGSQSRIAATVRGSGSVYSTWAEARALLAGLPGGALNIAHEAVDRHVAAGHGGRLAIRWLAKSGTKSDFSYADLMHLASKFANVLGDIGLKRDERVFTLLGRVPALYAAALGTWKFGAVFSPLFSAFGPEPAMSRMEIGDARVLVTTAALYRKKIASVRNALPGLRHILIVGGEAETVPQGLDLDVALSNASGHFTTVATRPDDVAIIHFTSGTTGKPKGAVHAHEAVVAHHVTGKCALDFQDGDIFWCTADPGWVTGTSYGIISPLTNAISMIVDEAEFDAERWYAILEDQRVTVWYTAPTAIRMLMKGGDEPIKRHDLSRLRFMASVGEPLNAEAVIWSAKAFGKPFHDNWWQTETGGIMIANVPDQDVKPGSMGKPLPGIAAAIVQRNADGRVGEIDRPMTMGELALKQNWPSMFRAYLNEPARYAKCFADGWYLTGDLAMRDDDGYFWFVGRADDVIKSAGHLIGPFEVESALMAFPIPWPARSSKPSWCSSRTSNRRMRYARSLSATRGRRLAPRSRRARSTFGRICRRPVPARSCGVCSRRASWDCPKAISQHWRATRNDGALRDQAASDA